MKHALMFATMECRRDLTCSLFMFIHPISPTSLYQTVLYSVDELLIKNNHKILPLHYFIHIKSTYRMSQKFFNTYFLAFGPIPLLCARRDNFCCRFPLVNCTPWARRSFASPRAISYATKGSRSLALVSS